ncbi:small acid-soluble spore protein Tlp [Halalkalibacillus halophilus]|uniref:small acid-soluble spore protein Tlp n=1 Tax=Halalkalibacillus halophilus TaxID=392827 RepID=UPI0003FB0352|nr:small acid-soluble spore protein Tlp [Halalkalibacillus halophilus]
MRNNPNPDDRSDNVEQLQSKVQDTIENYREAKEEMEHASDKDRKTIEAKNERRKQSIKGMRNEISDEAKHQE